MPSQTLSTKTTTQMKKVCSIDKPSIKCLLKEQIKNSLRVQDEVNFIQRYEWNNLPEGFTSEMIERMLYYKYSLIFFKINDDFYLLPYTFNGDIDIYGRFKNVKPLPFFNGKDETKKKDSWLSSYIKKVFYDKIEVDDPENYCVILRDYTNQLQELCTPRAILQEPLLDYQAEIVAMHRTSLINSSGIEAIRVNDENEIDEIDRLNDKVQSHALSGKKYVAVSSKIEMQNLDSHSAPNSQQFMTAYASIDNLRLSNLGVANGGVQEKQGTIIQAEAEAGKSNSNQILDDGLANRLHCAELFNYLFNYNISVKIKDSAMFDNSNNIDTEREENARDNL